MEWRGNGTHNQPAGTWSDDGALMLALLDSLLDAGFDPDDQGRRSLDWFTTGPIRARRQGVRLGRRHEHGDVRPQARRTPALDAGPSGERDCGNGSLMRILPLALVERDVTDERLVEMAHLASRVTHGHPRCQVACALYSLVVRRLLAGESDRAAVLADARSRLRAMYARRLADGAPGRPR